MRDTRLWLCPILLTLASPTHAAVIVLARGDAAIAHDVQGGSWTLTAAGAALSIAADESHDFQMLSLRGPAGGGWLASPTPGLTITASGAALRFGKASSGFQFTGASTVDDGRVLRLDVTYASRAMDLIATRHFQVTTGSPTFEVWTTLRSTLAAGRAVSNVSAIDLSIPAGIVRWVTGHDSPDPDGAFQRRQRLLRPGESLALGSAFRSSEQVVPWIAVDGAQEEFYAALMWSGAWSMQIARSGPALAVSAGLGGMSTIVGPVAVDGPHILIGAATGGVAEASAALRSYIINGIRGGRPLAPLVTYNTWFAYGTNIDAASMQAEMARAAALGAELFVIDAGWYAGADLDDPSDFDTGLGSWTPDPARFPDGLHALVDYAHSLGMRFGIWVEPERVNLSVVAAGELDEDALATSGGRYGSDRTAQVCLAGPKGRQWVLDRLQQFLDEVQPDYLKWDNNLWVNCDREGHGHGPSDGNFAHVTALYAILQELRARYPDMLIENCSSGGNRLDFGMLRYTDTAWMDDRTAPSVHVRHNLEGLTAAFPPAYLLSFVTDHEDQPTPEPLRDPPDLPLYVRSRMGGVLGLCFRGGDLSATDLAGIAAEIAVYKDLRPTLVTAAGALLTLQAEAAGAPPWDVLQATAEGGGTLLVFAFQNDGGADAATVRPADLDPAATYQVSSVDAGVLGSASGADLIRGGIAILASPSTAAHILRIERLP